MIVADTNLIAYLTIPGDRTPLAKQILQKDAIWVAPRMWQSEFQNVIAIYLNQGLYTLDEGLEFIQTAKNLMRHGDYQVASEQVIRLAHLSKCSAYDCEFVALAQDLSVPLVTSDRKVLTAFPEIAVSLEDFLVDEKNKNEEEEEEL